VIAFVQGTVAALAPDSAVLQLGGDDPRGGAGIGLSLQCTPATLAGLRLGGQARLAASLVVREDSLTLYGFADDDERAVFELLQTASGVGPRLAQAMLAVHAPDALRQAVASGDEKALTLVPGIGRKGAQRLLLELKDRLGAPSGSPASQGAAAAASAPWRDQLSAALVGLGWSTREADEAVETVTPEAEAAAAAGAAPDVAVLLRSALRSLGRR
jgi:holliday junction DNA helicase RuvA